MGQALTCTNMCGALAGAAAGTAADELARAAEHVLRCVAKHGTLEAGTQCSAIRRWRYVDIYHAIEVCGPLSECQSSMLLLLLLQLGSCWGTCWCCITQSPRRPTIPASLPRLHPIPAGLLPCHQRSSAWWTWWLDGGGGCRQ